MSIRDDRTDEEKAVWQTFASKLQPDPETGTVNGSDILTFMREHESDPSFQALLASSLAREKDREASIPYSSLPYFTSFASDPAHAPRGLWRIRTEYRGLIDPDVDEERLIEPHEVAAHPGAKHSFRLQCDVPDTSLSGRGRGMPGEEVDVRCVEDFYGGMPKSDEVLKFVKKAMVNPISCFHPGLPVLLRLTHDLEPHRPVLAPFLDAIAAAVREGQPGAAFEWEIEDAATAERIGALTYSKASFFFTQHKTAGLRSKEQGNASFRAGNTPRAIDHYTQALRRFEDAHCQKVMDHEKKEVMDLIARTIANRSAALLLPGPKRDVGMAVNDAKLAVYADRLYAKGYARLAKAHQAAGDLPSALDVLADALRIPELQNEVGLVDMLVDLQTGGKGLPEGKEELESLRNRLLRDDKESARRMAGVGGLWRERLGG